MEFIFSCLRWTGLFLLLWGTCSVITRHIGINTLFAPITVISALTVTTYYGGLLGVLLPTVYLLVGLMSCCLIYTLVTVKKRSFLPTSLPTTQVVFLLVFLAFLSILAQTQLVHYDNFTHWALVVKEMLITNAIPSTNSTSMMFYDTISGGQHFLYYNYPIGSASWIYFVCTLVGTGESVMIVAQGLLIFAAFYALFGVITDRRRFMLVLALGAAQSLMSVFNITIRINNLLVDFLLPVLTLAAISITYSHRQDIRKVFFCVPWVLGLLGIIKNSGTLFLAIGLLYFLYVIIRYRNSNTLRQVGDLPGKRLYTRDSGNRYFIRSLLPVLFSVLPVALWQLHTKFNFVGMTNKFSTDFSVVSGGIADKSAEQVESIVQLFITNLLDINQRATLGILLANVVAILACLIARFYLKRKGWALPRVLILMNLLLVAYFTGILAMYLYSMPVAEALELAAFERYSSSMVILFIGVISVTLIIDIEHSFHYQLGQVDDSRAFQSLSTKSTYYRTCCVCALFAFLMLSSEYNGMSHQLAQEQTALPVAMKQAVGDYWGETNTDHTFLVFATDENEQVTNYFTYYMARYYLRATNVDTLCWFDEANFTNLLSQYDYLVIIENTPEQLDLMQRYLGVDGAPGIYDLSPLH